MGSHTRSLHVPAPASHAVGNGHSWDGHCVASLHAIVHSAHVEGVLSRERAAALLSLCDSKMQLRGGWHAWTEHELCVDAAADLVEQQNRHQHQKQQHVEQHGDEGEGWAGAGRCL